MDAEARKILKDLFFFLLNDCVVQKVQGCKEMGKAMAKPERIFEEAGQLTVDFALLGEGGQEGDFWESVGGDGDVGLS